MKKLITLFILCYVILLQNGYAQLKVNSNGYVGINRSTPSYNLDWYGTGRFGGNGWGDLIFDNNGYYSVATLHPRQNWAGCLGTSSLFFNVAYVDHLITNMITNNSDERFKENIRDLENPLKKLSNIRGVRYDFKKEFFDISDEILGEKLANERQNQIGFVAQEIKEIFPELVFLDTTSNRYSVNYIGLIPVLVESVKKQQQIINELKDQIADCCVRNETDLKSASLEEAEIKVSKDKAILYQNLPNPFNQKTTIKCYIPESNLSATLYIFNMQGTMLQQFSISAKGNQLIQVDGYSLDPGMYLYTLVVAGKEIDTKRMILTQ